MTDMKNLLEKIIPPADYQHRNGFSNRYMIDALNGDEKARVEIALIDALNNSDDSLIGETLAYMKSVSALPILRQKLARATSPASKINWASYIVSIDAGETGMRDIAFTEFNKVKASNELIFLFHILIIFNDDRITEKIRSSVNDKDYLLAYNARTALGLATEELIQREQTKNSLR